VSPQIQCEAEVLEVSVHATEEELLAGVSAQDNRDGDLTEKIMIQGVSRLLTENTARITYVVADSSDNIASCTRTLHYIDYFPPRFALTGIPVYSTDIEMNALSELKKTLTAVDTKDGDLSGQIRILAKGIDVSLENTHILTIEVTNSLGGFESIPLTIVIDNEGAMNPLVTLREYITYVSAGSDFEPKDYVLTVNGEDFEGSYPALRIHSEVDTQIPGAYQVCYQYKDFKVYQTVVVR
jgi:hypothetical protein